jgi:hypothetical protein
VTVPNDTAGDWGIQVHRLLDEAFGGVEMSPDRQDLKEEIRANLLVRAAELEATGLAPRDAAHRAVEELGEVSAILDVPPPEAGSAGPGWMPQRIRPNPVFLVRAVVLAALGTVGLAVLVLAATLLDVPPGWQVAAVAVAALAAGAVTADALRQETTGNHPMPTGRAVGYGIGAVLGWSVSPLAGCTCACPGRRGSSAARCWSSRRPRCSPTSVPPRPTGTRRVLRMGAPHAQVADRFTTDPAAAARFGLYTVTTWLVVLAAFVALTLTAGWAWSWLTVVAGFAAMALMIARMLFTPRP